MWFWLIASVLLIYILNLIKKYVIRPYLQMRKFKNFQGAQMIAFTPLTGAFSLIKQAYQKYGDQLFYSKNCYKIYPKCRFIVTNLLDRVFLVVTHPQLIKQFYIKQQNYVKYNLFVAHMMNVIGNSTPFLEGKKWQKRRKIVSQVFHFEFFKTFIPIIKKFLSQQLQQISKNKQFNALDFGSIVATQSVISSFFGISCKQQIQGVKLPTWMNRLISQLGLQQKSIRYFLFGTFILKMGLFKKDRQANQKIKLYKSWAKQQINNKINQNITQQNTIVNFLKKKQLLNTPHGISTDELLQQFMAFIVAGSDTTSHLIAFSLYYLTNQLSIQQQLRKQILASPITNPSSVNDYNSFKYLDGFIKQVFRHSGYMNSIFPRICTKKHFLGDVEIPQGTLVSLGWLQNNYNDQYFQDANKFNVERWLKQPQHQNHYIFTPFSSGPRTCLGNTFALLQTKILLVSLIKNYSLKLKPNYIHKLKMRNLYQPQNPIIIQVQQLKS